MTKKLGRVMKDFRIDRISLVDKPAQEGAEFVLMKRAPESEEELGKAARRREEEEEEEPEMPEAEDDQEEVDEDEDELPVHKRMLMLSTVDGHTHLVDDTGMDSHTSYEKAPDDEYGHTHPWVRDEDGMIVIGMADGHSHQLLAKRVQPTNALGAEYLPPVKSLGTNTENDDMSGQDKDAAALAKAAEREGKLNAELTLAKAYGALSDSEKAHYATLDEGGKASFLAKPVNERQADVAKRAAQSEVEYTADDGTVYRKGDDPRMVSMAKRADESARAARNATSQLEQSTLAKRAGDELGNLPGDLPTKTALLKAVDGIADKAAREGAVAILKAGNEALAKSFERRGTSDAGSSGATAKERLDTLAKSYSTANKVSVEEAHVAVLGTKEGAELYAEMQRR